MNDKPPFAVDGPVDLAAKVNDRKGQPASWKQAPVETGGLIDLGAIYSRDADQAAFGYTEVASPTARPARMAVRSDDTLTVWLNGKQVYDFQGSRSLDYARARGRDAGAGGEPHPGQVRQPGRQVGLLRRPGPPDRGVQPGGGLAGPRGHAGQAPAPFATDQPVDLAATHKDRKGQPAPWKAVKPANAQGGIDLAAHFSTDDREVAAFGVAEVKPPRPRAPPGCGSAPTTR